MSEVGLLFCSGKKIVRDLSHFAFVGMIFFVLAPFSFQIEALHDLIQRFMVQSIAFCYKRKLYPAISVSAFVLMEDL